MADEFPSSLSHVLAEVFHLSHLQDFFVCNSFLPAYLKYPSKTSVLEDVDLFSSLLFIFHVSQPYIKTGFTSVLYSLTLVRSTVAVAAPDLFQSQECPSPFNYSIVDVLSASAFFGNCSSQIQKSMNILFSLPIHFHRIVAPPIYSQQFTFVHINFQSHPFCFMGQLIGLGLNVLLGR